MLFWYQIFKFMLFDMRNERDSVVVGIVGIASYTHSHGACLLVFGSK